MDENRAQDFLGLSIFWRHIAGTPFVSNLEFSNRAGLIQSSLYTTTLISFSKFLNESELEKETPLANTQTLIGILAVIAARVASKNNQRK